MRAFLLSFAVLAVAGPAAAAGGADSMFAERRALLAADMRCDLFTPALRQALEASTFQARTTLLRSGWTAARADDLGRRAAAEVSSRPCGDPVLTRAAADARTGFAGWARLMSMRFPGVERAWLARRAPDPQGFYIRQDIPGARTAIFGVRRDGQGGSLVLMLPLAEREFPPASARISFRDTARAPRSVADTPGRTITGLAGAVASPSSARVTLARTRTVETSEHGAHGAQGVRSVVFVFPDAVLAQIKALDPRDAVAITVDARTPVTLLIEVGDIAAAHAFLAAEGVG